MSETGRGRTARLRAGAAGWLWLCVLLWLAGTGAALAAAATEPAAPPATTVVAEGQAPALAPVPPLTAPVVDTTGSLDAGALARLEELSLGLQRRHGAQLVVLLVASTGPEDIADYAQRVFEQWQPGRRGLDDGLLVVVAREDRRVRIQVGYGLEEAVPDIAAGRVIDEYFAPAFRDGDYAGGLERGVQALAGLVEGIALPEPDTSLPLPLKIFAGLMISPFVLIPLFAMRAAWRAGPLAFFGRWAIVAAVVAGLYFGLIRGAAVDPEVAEWERWMPLALLSYLTTVFVFFSAFASGGGRWSASTGGGTHSRDSGSSSSSGYSGGGGRSGGGGASGSW